MVKPAFGRGKTCTVLLAESVQIPYCCKSFTVYVPGLEKVFDGLVAEELVPSPKFQAVLMAAADEVLVNVTGEPKQILSGAVNEVVVFCKFNRFSLRMVSTQPSLLFVISVTVYDPVCV